MTESRTKRILSVLLTVFCLQFSGVFADEQPASTCRLTILHTNDLHAHDDPFMDRGKTVGGMAKIAHIIHGIRAKDPNVLVIDAGDIFQGTPYFQFYHGLVEVEMLNAAGYDIYTIGNHEFDDGADNLAQQLSKAKFSIINANMDASAKPELAALIKPSVVKEVGGQKIGFVGAIVPNLTHVSLTTGGVKVKDADTNWTKPIADAVAKLKSQGIDKIVLVTHCGVELDRQLASLPDVDAIVGGHSHTRLARPILIRRPDGSSCIIVQTGCYGRALGKLDLAFAANGTLDVAHTHSALIPITENIAPDEKLQAYLDEKSKPFISMRRNIVGVAGMDFDNAFRRYPGDSPIGKLIADALAEGAAQYGATIAFQNRGGIRGRMDRGIITEEKVNELLPFENHLVVATVTGEALRQCLENSVSSSLGARFLDVHGVRFEWNPLLEPMHRVKAIWTVNDRGKLTPLDPKADYRIAINSYSFGGGEEYDFSKAKDIKDTGTKLAVYLQNYLIKHKKVFPDRHLRIVPLAAMRTRIQNNHGPDIAPPMIPPSHAPAGVR